MSYNLTQLTFPSSDGKNTVYAEVYTPKTETAKGIVQLAHGMIDYTGRYTALAEFLTDNGYIFAGNHHLGHGKTAASAEDFGFFAERGGMDFVIDDMRAMNARLSEMFPTLPIVLFGHSMGSFLSRIYAVRYPKTISGLVIHGTGGKNPLVGMGIMLSRFLKSVYGSHHRSPMIDKIAFGSYNKRFPKEEGEDAWLTRDVMAVADRPTDPYTSFKFTVSGYTDLFTALRESNSKGWYKSYPKELPTLIMSGDADPVGDYGRGPAEVYRGLLLSGATAVEMKLYEGARHELFKETNKEEVFSDLLGWLRGVI